MASESTLPDGWTIEFSRDGGLGVTQYQASLFWRDDCVCRLSVAGDGMATQYAEQRLIERASSWISEYMAGRAEC